MEKKIDINVKVNSIDELWLETIATLKKQVELLNEGGICGNERMLITQEICALTTLIVALDRS